MDFHLCLHVDIGFLLLMISTLWLIDARQKFRQFRAKWRQIRRGR
jgi:hypothetical protein